MQESLEKIGVMADSHGRADAISRAVELLRGRGCQTLVHLGDICDSERPETADECVGILKEAGILCVRGNNDHWLLAAREGRPARFVSAATFAFLESLPPARTVAGAVMAHSLPFVRRMGLSAMARPMGDKEFALFFSENPRGVLFRGHSHAPVLVRPSGAGVEHVPLSPGESVAVSRPMALTCGALTRGLCVEWDPAAEVLALLSFPA
ncbi:MAG: metallophosphoesterase family protein [Pseudomonadota bacterium]